MLPANALIAALENDRIDSITVHSVSPIDDGSSWLRIYSYRRDADDRWNFGRASLAASYSVGISPRIEWFAMAYGNTIRREKEPCPYLPK